MKIAYLVLAHNTPNHITRLIQSLKSSSSYFFVHIDNKANIENFIHITDERTYFTNNRVSVYWGDFSQVEAVLELLHTAKSSGINFDRYVLLSGSDYPLRSVEYIENFFLENQTTEFINFVQMPADDCGKPISRLIKYRIRNDKSLAYKFKFRLKQLLGLAPRNRDYKQYLNGIIPYAGSQWWALTGDAVEYILEFVKNNNIFTDFFENTIVPDESFFHTVIGTSPFKDNISRNLTYTDWSGQKKSPAIISENHIQQFKDNSFRINDSYGSGEILFARKFPNESSELVASIKNNLHRDKL